MPFTFGDVAKAKYILLTTFTKDGRPKPTPIWAAPDGDRLVVITQVTRGRSSGSATPRGSPWRCATVRGNVEERGGRRHAAILDKSRNGDVYDAIGKRYGIVGKMFNVFSKYLRGGMQKNVALELKAA